MIPLPVRSRLMITHNTETIKQNYTKYVKKKFCEAKQKINKSINKDDTLSEKTNHDPHKRSTGARLPNT